MQPLSAITLEPPQAADACVIWCHGLGADGHDFAPIVPELELPADHSIRFIFPHAPRRAVTINRGMHMPAWYDILGWAFGSPEDAAGIHAGVAAVSALIEQQIDAGIPAARIVIAGFSQGGALALHAGCRFPQKLGGIMVLSSYLAIAREFPGLISDQNKTTSIFMAHGLRDTIVPCEWGQMACEQLMALGYSVQWHPYPMAHEVCAQEIADISQWIQSICIQ